MIWGFLFLGNHHMYPYVGIFQIMLSHLRSQQRHHSSLTTSPWEPSCSRNGLTGQSPVEQLTSGHISPFNDGQGFFAQFDPSQARETDTSQVGLQWNHVQ